ncbi:MAG: NAD(P) transhydrogenase subunit alpha part 2 [Planctomycetota bacterium]|jgi:NAD(P) transhydrogenase subunit alpha
MSHEMQTIASIMLTGASGSGGVDPLIFNLTVFVLSIFVGYFVVWSVTPALHTPLMSVTNAISSVIIVGALIAAAPPVLNMATIVGYIAVAITFVNIFGGFLVTQRMLEMFKKK